MNSLSRCIHCGEETVIRDPWKQVRQVKIFLTYLEWWRDKRWQKIFPRGEEDQRVRVIHCEICAHAEDEILGQFFSNYMFRLLFAFVVLVNGLMLLYTKLEDGVITTKVDSIFIFLWLLGFIVLVYFQYQETKKILQNENVLHLAKVNRVVWRRTKFFIVILDLIAFFPVVSLFLFLPLSAIYFLGGLEGIPRKNSPNLCTYPVPPYCQLCGIEITPHFTRAFGVTIAAYNHNNLCPLTTHVLEIREPVENASNVEHLFLRKLHGQALKKEKPKFLFVGLLMLIMCSVSFYIFLEDPSFYFQVIFPGTLLTFVVMIFWVIYNVRRYLRLRHFDYWRKTLK